MPNESSSLNTSSFDALRVLILSVVYLLHLYPSSISLEIFSPYCLFRESIKKEVVSSAGDEFQGLFRDVRSAFLYIRKLQLLIYPIKIRCGIGTSRIIIICPIDKI